MHYVAKEDLGLLILLLLPTECWDYRNTIPHHVYSVGDGTQDFTMLGNLSTEQLHQPQRFKTNNSVSLTHITKVAWGMWR